MFFFARLSYGCVSLADLRGLAHTLQGVARRLALEATLSEQPPAAKNTAMPMQPAVEARVVLRDG